MDFFKDEDANYDLRVGSAGGPYDPKLGTFVHKKISESNIPMISIAEANRLLRERGKIVKGLDADAFGWSFQQIWPGQHTHQALLINIQPVENDSYEKFVRDFLGTYGMCSKENYGHTGELVERAKKLISPSGLFQRGE